MHKGHQNHKDQQVIINQDDDDHFLPSQSTHQQQIEHHANQDHSHVSKTSPSSNNNNIQFGSTSIAMKCPFCLQNTNTQIIAKPQFISIILGLLLFCLMPNAIMIVGVIFVFQLTATRKHRCALCERQLGSDGKFLRIFKDQVYSFSITDTGILISKKILVSCALLFMTFLILYIRANFYTKSLEYTDKTWKQMIQVCPKDTFSVQCNTMFEDKTVQNWSGYIMKVHDQRLNFRKFYEHAAKFYVKMQPSEHSPEQPDIILTVSSIVAYQQTQVIDELFHGNQIKFNATFKLTKTESGGYQNRHFHLIDFQKTGVTNKDIKIYLTEQQKQLIKAQNGQGSNQDKNLKGKSLRVDPEQQQQQSQEQQVESNSQVNKPNA